MATVNLDSELLGQMIGSAVMQSITTEQRDTLIKAAVLHLLTPEKSSNSYSSTPTASPMQKAFNQAVELFATKFVRESLEHDDQFAATLKALLEEAVTKATTGPNREAVVEKMASAIASAFGPRY
jgi:hypothetical protein